MVMITDENSAPVSTNVMQSPRGKVGESPFSKVALTPTRSRTTKEDVALVPGEADAQFSIMTDPILEEKVLEPVDHVHECIASDSVLTETGEPEKVCTTLKVDEVKRAIEDDVKRAIEDDVQRAIESIQASGAVGQSDEAEMIFNQTCDTVDQPDALEMTPNEEDHGKLETYKMMIDATTKLRVKEDSWEENPSYAQSSMEWKDAASGTMMGYSCEHSAEVVASLLAACDECAEDADTDDMMDLGECGEVSEETLSPLQVTLEWQQHDTGIMLGYALCDENDMDLRAMHQLFEEGSEKAGTESNAPDESTMTPVTSDESNATIDEAETDNQQATMLQMLSEWKDPTTGASLGYAAETDPEDDSTDGHGADEKMEEWEDANTGVALGYECDDDSDFGDHLSPAKDAFEWGDLTTGVLMGYECDEDSDFGDHLEGELDAVQAERVEFRYRSGPLRNCKRGLSKRKFRPLVLRLRSQQLRRVIKSAQFRK